MGFFKLISRPKKEKKKEKEKKNVTTN